MPRAKKMTPAKLHEYFGAEDAAVVEEFLEFREWEATGKTRGWFAFLAAYPDEEERVLAKLAPLRRPA